jgi:hypothetical protein
MAEVLRTIQVRKNLCIFSCAVLKEKSIKKINIWTAGGKYIKILRIKFVWRKVAPANLTNEKCKCGAELLWPGEAKLGAQYNTACQAN